MVIEETSVFGNPAHRECGLGGIGQPVIKTAQLDHPMSELVPDRMTTQGLEAFLHEQIPLARAMGLRVVESHARRLVFEAPLENNINHQGTAFGGSLHALPTLVCYAGLWTLLREAGFEGHVVVKRSQAHYHTPVTGPLRAVWERPPAATVQEFVHNLERHKKARMDLSAIVEGPNGKAAVDFNGSFVALV